MTSLNHLTSYLKTGVILREQNQLLVYSDFSQKNAIKFVQKSSLLEGEVIIAWAKRLVSNDPPIKYFKIQSDAKSIVNFLIDEDGCNDVNLIDFKRNFVLPHNLKVIRINRELNGIAHSLAQYAFAREILESLNHNMEIAFETTTREEVWYYESGFSTCLIVTILEDFRRRLLKVKCGSSNNNNSDTETWPMLLDGFSSNVRTINN